MSMVKVITPATQTVLVSLDEVKATLGITDTSEDDVLGRLLKGASAAIETYIGRVLRKQTYEERVAGDNSQYLQLYNIPVGEVESIQYSGDITDEDEERSVVSSDSYLLIDPGVGLVYSDAVWPWSVRYKIGLTDTILPHQTIPQYVVRYTAGYEPVDSLSSYPYKMPWDIVEATIVTAKIWRASARRDPKVLMQKVDDLMVKYRFPSASGNEGVSSLPPEVTNILDAYADYL